MFNYAVRAVHQNGRAARWTKRERFENGNRTENETGTERDYPSRCTDRRWKLFFDAYCIYIIYSMCGKAGVSVYPSLPPFLPPSLPHSLPPSLTPSLQTLIVRDVFLLLILSAGFELMEYTLECQLPNFGECWWDHVSRGQKSTVYPRIPLGNLGYSRVLKLGYP